MVRFCGVVLTFAALVACSSGVSEPTGLRRIEISLVPNVATLMINDTTRARLSGFDQNGQPYPAGPVTWRSSTPAVASVAADGLVLGLAPGVTRIVATVGGVSDSVQLSVAGTLHERAIAGSETWTLATSPHVVRGRLIVGAAAGATLTIAGGAEIIFENGAGLTFDSAGRGSLVAQGTASQAIAMHGAGTVASPGSWIGITLLGAPQSELHHVTMSGCGAPRSLPDDEPAACLVVGHRFPGADPVLLVDDVTIQDAAAAALVLQGQARFAAGSATFSVRNVHGYVASVPAAAAGGFPHGGSFAGNDINELRLEGDTIRQSATWDGAGLAWVVTGRVLIEGPQWPVLTIPAGTSLKFAFGAGFLVGKNAPGGLQVGSVGGATVNLTTADANGWAGIIFFGAERPSFIRSAVLENCGSYNDSGHGQGCVFVLGPFTIGFPPELIDVTIRKAIDVGVVFVGEHFSAQSNNLVITQTRGSPGAPFSMDADLAYAIPPGVYTGNTLDAVWVMSGEVTHTASWFSPGIPYMIRQGLNIGGSVDPILTLNAGVELRFAPGGILAAGVVSPGAVRAIGAAGNPVVVRSEFAFAGAWMGIVIGTHALNSLLDQVTVDYAGADDGTFATGIRVDKDYGEIIRNTLVRRSGGCGITRVSGTSWTTDFTAPQLGNTFQSNAGQNQCGP
jgi:Big-like domain-containing protein